MSTHAHAHTTKPQIREHGGGESGGEKCLYLHIRKPGTREGEIVPEGPFLTTVVLTFQDEAKNTYEHSFILLLLGEQKKEYNRVPSENIFPKEERCYRNPTYSYFFNLQMAYNSQHRTTGRPFTGRVRVASPRREAAYQEPRHGFEGLLDPLGAKPRRLASPLGDRFP